MDIKTRKQGEVWIMELHGRFDAFETVAFNQWLEQYLPSSKPKLIINMSGVTFIDSSALGALVKVMKRCREQAGELRLCALQQAVRVIFELTQLHKAFSLYADEEGALEGFSPSRTLTGLEVSSTDFSVRIHLLALAGRLDITTAGALREKQDALLNEGVARFVLDLSDLSFLDSGGFATLVNLLKRARAMGGDVVLVSPTNETVQRIISLTKFDRVFKLYPSKDDALKGVMTSYQL